MRTVLTAVLVVWSSLAHAGTLEDVRSNGVVQCGVENTTGGFSAVQKGGAWSGLPVDYCRALAVAVLGDGNKVSFMLLEPADRIEALQSGEVDVLVTSLPVAAEYEGRDGLLFTEPLFENTAKDNHEFYAAAVRQGDDQWFVVARWLRTVLMQKPEANESDCYRFNALQLLEKDWACKVLLHK